MSATPSKHSGWTLILVGALGVLAIEAALWGGWRLWGGCGCRQSQSAATAESPPQVPVDPAPAAIADGGSAPDAVQPVAAGDADADSAKPEATVADATSPDVSAGTEDLTPEEVLARKARESVERAAEDERRIAAMDEAERTFWEGNFDKYKTSIMEMIDGYFDRPMEERFDFVMEYNKEFMTQLMADRKAANMPAEVRNPQKVNEQFIQMLGARMTDEEAGKFKAYVNDVVKMQLARMNVQLDKPDSAPQPVDAPAEQP
ncbi:MAG: hypothetical protein JXL80_15310 [Planctomycetes bacterium]|nr:hypothetical protein [Planctomycetota bacterium]